MTKTSPGRRARFVWGFVVTLGIGVAVVPASVAAQSPTFARSDYPLATNDLIVADFNGDRRPDLAGLVATGAAVLIGNGDGTFQPIVTYPVFSWSQALAAGDFNGDGHVDLMVTINDINIGLSLLIGRGDGTFDAAVHFPNTSRLDSPAIAATDLDNDGTLDVVVGHQIACYTAPCVVGRSITVMRGNGNGTFQPAREITVGSGTAMIAVGDFNRDGVKDLGLASDSSRVLILRGAGDATFVQQPTLTLTADTLGVDATDIDVADVNGDTIQDLVVAIALNGSRTAILIGNGDGTFRPPSIITEPQIRVPQYQAVADYNGDGFQDLAMTLGFGSNGLMEIRNGNGDGTFGPLVLYLQPPPQSSIGGLHIVSADFNGDGKPDIALNYGGASAGVVALRNTTGAAAAATLSSVTVTPSTVVGGASSTARVTLSAAAPGGGAVIALSDNSSAVTTPTSITVPAGSTSATATITTMTVTASTSATVSAVYAGVTRSASLKVNPAAGPAATITVAVTGRSGERVTSSPAGINVAVGSTGSASFSTGTSITLSVSGGRDAVWSGACSSGGNKRKSCTFTVNGNASVSASVK